MAEQVQGLINGTISPAAFAAATSTEVVMQQIEQAELKGVLFVEDPEDPSVILGPKKPQRDSKALGIGLGVGLGVGLPALAVAAWALLYLGKQSAARGGRVVDGGAAAEDDPWVAGSGGSAVAGRAGSQAAAMQVHRSPETQTSITISPSGASATTGPTAYTSAASFTTAPTASTSATSFTAARKKSFSSTAAANAVMAASRLAAALSKRGTATTSSSPVSSRAVGLAPRTASAPAWAMPGTVPPLNIGALPAGSAQPLYSPHPVVMAAAFASQHPGASPLSPHAAPPARPL